MVREPNKPRTYRLSNTVYNEIEKIVKEDGIRSINELFEKFIVSYEKMKAPYYKNISNESEKLEKDMAILKKDLSTLLYLNGNMSEFFSMTDINDIDNNSLINQSKDKVERDIQKKQVNKSFNNY